MGSTCLIVCFYEGSRDYKQEQNFQNYINAHKTSLKKLKHNLSKVIFVISQDKIEKPIMTETDGITYYYRKNLNLSFGGWVDTMKIFKNKYDYYILCEDDYIFTKNNFDTILVNQYISKNTEYLVTWKEFESRTNKFILNSELISTVGIMHNKYINLLNTYNHNHFNKNKAMHKFLASFNKISCLDNEFNLFPYWDAVNARIYMYGIGKWEDVCDKKDIEYSRILLACYQFYVKHATNFNVQ